MQIFIQITAGADTGPLFNLASNADVPAFSGFESGVNKADLVAGYTTEAPAGTTTVSVTSTGDCTNSINIVLGTTSTTSTTSSTSTTTSTTTSSPIHTFTDIPRGVIGNVFITSGTPPSSIFLTGSPFVMSPNSINPPTTTATLNFTDGSTTTNNTISFTLGGTSTTTAAFSNLQIQDDLGTTYNGVLSGGSGTNVVVTFTLGAPSNRIFGFLGGEVNLQFP